MKIEMLREFLVLARLNNFGRAARELHITQSNLSKHIQSLEKETNALLVERRKDGPIRLTPAGESLIQNAPVILNAYEKALKDCQASKARKIHRLTVVECNYFASYRQLFGELVAFGRENPDIEFRYVPPGRVLSEEAVEDGAVDLAIAFYCGIGRESMLRAEGRRLDAIQIAEREPIGIWMHTAHPLAAKGAVKVVDLDGYGIMANINDNLSPMGAGIRDMLYSAGVVPRMDIRSTGSDTEFYSLDPCSSVYVIPSSLVQDYRIMSRAEMVFRPIEDENYRIVPHILVSKDSDNPAVARFLEFRESHA